jgi:hypothetical protein
VQTFSIFLGNIVPNVLNITSRALVIPSTNHTRALVIPPNQMYTLYKSEFKFHTRVKRDDTEQGKTNSGSGSYDTQSGSTESDGVYDYPEADKVKQQKGKQNQNKGKQKQKKGKQKFKPKKMAGKKTNSTIIVR